MDADEVREEVLDSVIYDTLTDATRSVRTALAAEETYQLTSFQGDQMKLTKMAKKYQKVPISLIKMARNVHFWSPWQK